MSKPNRPYKKRNPSVLDCPTCTRKMMADNNLRVAHCTICKKSYTYGELYARIFPSK